VGGYTKEVIPVEYKPRYQKWKKEFLATPTGRGQWEMYAHNPRLVLTITVSGDRFNGAITDKFEWGDSGHLIAVTITLGGRLDEGYPGPEYYPVLSSLKPLVESDSISKHILAAAKTAPEKEPARNNYSSNLAYLRDKAHWILAQKVKQQVEPSEAMVTKETETETEKESNDDNL